MRHFRQIGAVALVIIALAIFFMRPPVDRSDAHTAAVSQALNAATVNEADADSAPKQQVVNGWTARDLLAIIADDQALIADEQARALDRVSGLLVLVTVGLGALLLLERRVPDTAAVASTADKDGPASGAPTLSGDLANDAP